MKRKLNSTKAETLLETMISLLIAVLSVALLSTGVMAAARINAATKESDETFAKQLAEAEMGEALNIDGHTVTFRFADGTQTTKVDVYGTGDFASYEKE